MRALFCPEVVKAASKAEKQRLNNFKKIRIGTWNVRSLYEGGKTHNAIKEMRRTNVDILGVSETRWPGSGECEVDGY